MLWIVSFTLILNLLGLKEVSLALGGSIALVAMGISKSLTSIVSDLLSGIFLLTDKDFYVGKEIKAAGVEGVVENLTIRKTKIRDSSGDLCIIPNSKVDNGNLIIKN